MYQIILVKIGTQLFFLGYNLDNDHNKEENLPGSPEMEISNHRN